MSTLFLMLRSIDWDKVRLLILAAWAVFAIVRWFKKSVRVRGKRETMGSVLRFGISVLGGTLLAFVALLLGRWGPDSVWGMPMVPGFLIGAITVGVHRGDNQLLYIALLLNALIYGSIVFVCYPLLIRNRLHSDDEAR
jgi:hypothetical protein